MISLSADAGEQCFTPAVAAQGNSILQAAQRDRVSVVISSGDSGAATDACPGAGTASAPVKGVDWPASDPLTLAVGGTSLQASRATGAYLETAWNIPPAEGSSPEASGGGFSRLFPRAAYQDGIVGIGATRGVPDVAADADPGTGMALAISDGGQDHILIGAGGTSAAAPLWAAAIALADQYAGRNLGFVNPALYQIGRSAYYHQAFHDVTTGTNTVEFARQTITDYQAAPGWDPVTGWGSPNAQVLVPLLARYASPCPRPTELTLPAGNGCRWGRCWPGLRAGYARALTGLLPAIRSRPRIHAWPRIEAITYLSCVGCSSGTATRSDRRSIGQRGTRTP